MGGDHGPAVIVEGAADAVREFGASVILVGNRDAIEREIARLNVGNLGLEIRHASQVVGMAESPSQALRRKRDSSLSIAAELVRDGHASAFISAGNTGAAMAIAMFVIGVLRGIDRPAIATVLPSLKRATVLLDVGANVAPKPWHLFQFALMGHAYARDILGALIKEELTRDLRSKIGAALSTPAITRFRKRVDYTEFGGAPLLGIDGEAIICHGRSRAKAIKNAVRVAGEWAKKGLNEHIRAALEAEVARGGREGGRE